MAHKHTSQDKQLYFGVWCKYVLEDLIIKTVKTLRDFFSFLQANKLACKVSWKLRDDTRFLGQRKMTLLFTGQQEHRHWPVWHLFPQPQFL